MSKKAKVGVVCLVALFALGGLAPAASARKTIGQQMGTAVERMETGVNRVEDRLVGNVEDEVACEVRWIRRFVDRDLEREILELGLWLERYFSPRGSGELLPGLPQLSSGCM